MLHLDRCCDRHVTMGGTVRAKIICSDTGDAGGVCTCSS